MSETNDSENFSQFLKLNSSSQLFENDPYNLLEVLGRLYEPTSLYSQVATENLANDDTTVQDESLYESRNKTVRQAKASHGNLGCEKSYIPSTSFDIDSYDNEILNTEQQALLKFSSYKDFKRSLYEYETCTLSKFVARNQSSNFHIHVCLHDILNNEKNSSDMPTIRWEFCATKDFLPIPFMGIPYISVGKQVYQCHQGKDYNLAKKIKYELKKELLSHSSNFQCKSRISGPSKKLGCPVMFALRKVYFFPEFPVGTDTKRNRTIVARRLRHELSKIKGQKCQCKLTEDVSGQDESSLGKLEYLTRFPQNHEHNHNVSKAVSSKILKSKLKKIELQLPKQVGDSVALHKKQLDLLISLRSSNDLIQLRAAREKMILDYPFSEELWLEWIHDEVVLPITIEQKHYTLNVFKSAIKEYASIKIWHLYLQYLVSNISSPSDIQVTRHVFEDAVEHLGHHVTDGAAVWEKYREFEMSILSSYQQLQNTDEKTSKIETQVQKISSLYVKELSIPLLGLESVYKSFQDWVSGPLPVKAEEAYAKASETLVLITDFEEKLLASQGNNLLEYLSYIEYAMKQEEEAGIQSLFERAVRDNSSSSVIWLLYTDWIDHNKPTLIALHVHERATKHRPVEIKLWLRYLLSVERNSLGTETYLKIFNKSLKCPFSNTQCYTDLWMSKCGYFRRQISDWNSEKDKVSDLQKCFEAGVTYMNYQFGEDGDKTCSLLREWAFIEAKYISDIPRAKKLWDLIMKNHKVDSLMWLEYSYFLLLHGNNISCVREVFQKAIRFSVDKREVVAKAFLKFEHQYGSLKDIDDAQRRVSSKNVSSEDKQICVEMQAGPEKSNFKEKMVENIGIQVQEIGNKNVNRDTTDHYGNIIPPTHICGTIENKDLPLEDFSNPLLSTLNPENSQP